MLEVSKNPERISTKVSRKPYASPALSYFGMVAELTTSGSVDTPEGTGTGNQNKAPML